jgi:hypothetical protein
MWRWKMANPSQIKNQDQQPASVPRGTSSVVTPTNVESRNALRIEDYRKKSCMAIQDMKIISKDFRWSKNRGDIAEIHSPGIINRAAIPTLSRNLNRETIWAIPQNLSWSYRINLGLLKKNIQQLLIEFAFQKQPAGFPR